MIQKIKQLFDEKLWKFLLVGVLNTLVGQGLQFLVFNLGLLNEKMASLLSTIIASVMSYFLNRYFTFKYQGGDRLVILRFALNIAVCYGIGYGLAFLAVPPILSGYSETVIGNISMVVGACLFVGLNYLGQRFFAFREKKQ